MELILFFNGWGVPKEFFTHLNEKDSSYKIKFVELEEDINLLNLEKYSEINIIAWSFGVYNASNKCFPLIKSNKLNIKKIIAINGSTKAINKNFGIPPKIFNATLNNINKDTYFKFLENIGLSGENTKYLEKYKVNLKLFGDNYNDSIPSIFNHAIISTKDRIFPKRALLEHYKDNNHKVIHYDHFPFYRWNNWKEVLNEF